jgi:DNA-directed RNA polymerase specialized sigma subunit
MMDKATIMLSALTEGHISEAEYREWVTLRARWKRLERLSWALLKGEKDPERTEGLTQQDVADILGVSQQSVAKSEKSAREKANTLIENSDLFTGTRL